MCPTNVRDSYLNQSSPVVDGEEKDQREAGSHSKAMAEVGQQTPNPDLPAQGSQHMPPPTAEAFFQIQNHASHKVTKRNLSHYPLGTVREWHRVLLLNTSQVFLVCSGHYNKMPLTAWLINNRIYFSHFWRLGHQGSRHQRICCLVRACFLVPRWCPLACCHVVERAS